MKRVSHADFVRKFSAFCDDALADPIVLTRNGRDRLIVVSVEKYRQLLSLVIMNVKDEREAADCVSDLESLVGRPNGSTG